MSDSPLQTLIQIDSDVLLHSLADADEKMKDYCRCETVRNILGAYGRYKVWFGLLKKPPLIEWCSQEQGSSSWFRTTNARRYAFTWTYSSVINNFIQSAKYSKNKIVYFSDSALKDYRHILYRTTDPEILQNIQKCKEENKELWDYLVKKNIV